MERNLWVSTQIVLLYLTLYTSAETIPANITIHVWEGNVTVSWEPPLENPGDCLYHVQVFRYIDSSPVWSSVPHCKHLKATFCNIGNFPVDSNYKVRVGAFTDSNNVSWSNKQSINILLSQLIAPTFTLSSTSDSVRVQIQRKQILEEIFINGVHYTTYLWPAGQKNQTLKKRDDDDDDDDDGEMTFISLKSLQVYCVLVKVESKATSASNISSVSCIKLPLDWKRIICLLFLGLLTITASLTLFICFSRRVRKMPSALKLVSVWKPMIIERDQVETVTDMGWIIISNSADTKKNIEEDSERRGSLDSGVSEEHLSISSAKTEGQNRDGQVDSGCGSLKGTEDSGDVRVTRQLSTHETHCRGKNEGREDSGLGLSSHEGSASLEGEDTGLLSGVEVGDGYRTQSPSSVDALNHTDSNMAAPSAGYKSGQGTCTCSEHEYCIWCKFKNTFTRDCQSVTQPQTDFRQITDAHSGSSSYLKKSLMPTLNLLNMEVQMTQPVQSEKNSTESPVILCSCPLQDLTHTGSFTLHNMELTFS